MKAKLFVVSLVSLLLFLDDSFSQGRRTATYDIDRLTFKIETLDKEYSSDDEIIIEYSIINQRDKEIYIPFEFEHPVPILDLDKKSIWFDLGLIGYFESDPLLAGRVPKFKKIKTRDSIELRFSLSKPGKNKIKGGTYLIEVDIGYLLGDIGLLRELLESDNMRRKHLDDKSFSELQLKFKPLTLGPIPIRIKP